MDNDSSSTHSAQRSPEAVSGARTIESKHPWPFNVLEEEWPKVKGVKTSFFLCIIASAIIGGTGVYFLYQIFIIPGKDTTIQLWKDNEQIQKEKTADSDNKVTNLQGQIAQLQTMPPNILTVLSNLNTTVSNVMLAVSTTTPKGGAIQMAGATAPISVITPTPSMISVPPVQPTTAPNPESPSTPKPAPLPAPAEEPLELSGASAEITNLEALAREFKGARERDEMQKEEDSAKQRESDLFQIDARLPLFRRAVNYMRISLANLARQGTNSLIDNLTPISLVVTSRPDLGSISVGTNSPWSFNIHVSRLERLTSTDGPGLVIEYTSSSFAAGASLGFSINDNRAIGHLVAPDGYIHDEILPSSYSNDISVVQKSINLLLAIPYAAPAPKGH